MHSLKILSFIFVLINLVQVYWCYLPNDYDSNGGLIKVENFYPPDGYQPVQGYEPPNYRPYKKIYEALNQRNLAALGPADFFQLADAGTNKPSNLKNLPSGNNKFIDRQTNIDIYKTDTDANNYVPSPMEHRINSNTFNFLSQQPVNSFLPQHEPFSNHNHQLSFETESDEYEDSFFTTRSNYKQDPVTSTNKPIFVANSNELNGFNSFIQQKKDDLSAERPTFQIQMYDDQIPFKLQPPHVQEHHQNTLNNNRNPEPVNQANQFPIQPPHLSHNFNSQNQNNINTFNNQLQNYPFNYNNNQQIDKQPPPPPYFINTNYKSNEETPNNWNSFVTSIMPSPAVTFKRPNLESNWRRTPPPNKYFWTAPVQQPSNYNPPPLQTDYPVQNQNFWTHPQQTTQPPQYPSLNYWTSPPTPASQPPSATHAYWTPPPPRPPPLPVTQNYWTPPETTASTAASGMVDFKELFMINKKNNTLTSNNNYNTNNNNNNVPIESVIDNNCMKCLCFIESWCSDVGCVWDQGSLSCGWYQLKYEYWIDCGQPGGGWKECANDKKCAEGCVRGYLKRYRGFCSAGQTCADLARIHNGGPYGCSSNTTEYYGWLIGRCLRREAPYENIDLIYKNLIDTRKISE